jgi:thiosulfate dehydrogenase (quinone) large subunit
VTATRRSIPETVPTGRDLDEALAYGILRLTLGVNIFLHGATRLLAGLGGFVSATVAQFSGTPMPEGAVRMFATALPFLETAVGFAILVGLWTRWGLVGGALLMTALVFGTAVRSDRTTLGIQMVTRSSISCCSRSALMTASHSIGSLGATDSGVAHVLRLAAARSIRSCCAVRRGP